MKKTGDYVLAWQYQKEMMKANLLSDDDIDRIADRVLSRLSITVDASDVLAKIEALRKAIDDLGR